MLELHTIYICLKMQKLSPSFADYNLPHIMNERTLSETLGSYAFQPL